MPQVIKINMFSVVWFYHKVNRYGSAPPDFLPVHPRCDFVISGSATSIAIICFMGQFNLQISHSEMSYSRKLRLIPAVPY